MMTREELEAIRVSNTHRQSMTRYEILPSEYLSAVNEVDALLAEVERLRGAVGAAPNVTDGEGHPDTRRLDWLDARVRAETPWRDTVVMFDHEDGMWLAEAERGEIRARALCHWRDATKDIRQAIDAARAQEAPRGPA